MPIPYSRYIVGRIPWYSFLIVAGAALAIFLASREEKKTSFPKDTVLDFALIVLPVGIIGARIYYVAFSWDSFRDDILSVFRIWEGGIAIYGAVIAGLVTAFLFCRKRKLSFFTLCDLIAPGLVLAQSIGRWGNYFNQEAYGAAVSNPSLCFFPLAVLIPEGSGFQWHMATFFYESVWDLLVFIFLIVARRRWFRYRGDVFCFYAFLYACGRFVIEDFRMDSLYASSSVRISQLLSILICAILIIRYAVLLHRHPRFRSFPVLFLLAVSLSEDLFMALWMTGIIVFPSAGILSRFLLLISASAVNIPVLFVLYGKCSEGEVIYANHKD